MHEELVNRLGGLSLARKSVVRLTDRPDMTLDGYRGRKTTPQQQQIYREASLQESCYRFVIVYDRDWSALKNQNAFEFVIRTI